MGRSKRRVSLFVVCCVAAASANTLAAQMIPTPAKHTPGANEGKRPTDWIVRADTTKVPGMKDTVRLVTIAPGWRITTGPGALAWTPKDVAQGTFVIGTSVYFGPPLTRDVDGYGVFFGGKNMQTPNATYNEFLVRNDGNFSLLRHENGKVTVLHPWTLLAGIGQHNGKLDHIVRNSFRVIADPASVQIVVNRVVAVALPRAQLPPDGLFGVRAGIGQQIQVDTLHIEPKRPVVLPESKAKPVNKGVPSGQRRG